MTARASSRQGSLQTSYWQSMLASKPPEDVLYGYKPPLDTPLGDLCIKDLQQASERVGNPCMTGLLLIALHAAGLPMQHHKSASQLLGIASARGKEPVLDTSALLPPPYDSSHDPDYADDGEAGCEQASVLPMAGRAQGKSQGWRPPHLIGTPYAHPTSSSSSASASTPVSNTLSLFPSSRRHHVSLEEAVRHLLVLQEGLTATLRAHAPSGIKIRVRLRVKRAKAAVEDDVLRAACVDMDAQGGVGKGKLPLIGRAAVAFLSPQTLGGNQAFVGTAGPDKDVTSSVPLSAAANDHPALVPAPLQPSAHLHDSDTANCKPMLDEVPREDEAHLPPRPPREGDGPDGAGGLLQLYLSTLADRIQSGACENQSHAAEQMGVLHSYLSCFKVGRPMPVASQRTVERAVWRWIHGLPSLKDVQAKEKRRRSTSAEDPAHASAADGSTVSSEGGMPQRCGRRPRTLLADGSLDPRYAALETPPLDELPDPTASDPRRQEGLPPIPPGAAGLHAVLTRFYAELDARGVSQTQAGSEAGLSPAYVSLWKARVESPAFLAAVAHSGGKGVSGELMFQMVTHCLWRWIHGLPSLAVHSKTTVGTGGEDDAGREGGGEDATGQGDMASTARVRKKVRIGGLDIDHAMLVELGLAPPSASSRQGSGSGSATHEAGGEPASNEGDAIGALAGHPPGTTGVATSVAADRARRSAAGEAQRKWLAAQQSKSFVAGEGGASNRSVSGRGHSAASAGQGLRAHPAAGGMAEEADDLQFLGEYTDELNPVPVPASGASETCPAALLLERADAAEQNALERVRLLQGQPTARQSAILRSESLPVPPAGISQELINDVSRRNPTDVTPWFRTVVGRAPSHRGAPGRGTKFFNPPPVADTAVFEAFVRHHCKSSDSPSVWGLGVYGTGIPTVIDQQEDTLQWASSVGDGAKLYATPPVWPLQPEKAPLPSMGPGVVLSSVLPAIDAIEEGTHTSESKGGSGGGPKEQAQAPSLASSVVALLEQRQRLAAEAIAQLVLAETRARGMDTRQVSSSAASSDGTSKYVALNMYGRWLLRHFSWALRHIHGCTRQEGQEEGQPEEDDVSCPAPDYIHQEAHHAVRARPGQLPGYPLPAWGDSVLSCHDDFRLSDVPLRMVGLGTGDPAWETSPYQIPVEVTTGTHVAVLEHATAHKQEGVPTAPTALSAPSSFLISVRPQAHAADTRREGKGTAGNAATDAGSVLDSESDTHGFEEVDAATTFLADGKTSSTIGHTHGTEGEGGTGTGKRKRGRPRTDGGRRTYFRPAGSESAHAFQPDLGADMGFSLLFPDTTSLLPLHSSTAAHGSGIREQTEQAHMQAHMSSVQRMLDDLLPMPGEGEEEEDGNELDEEMHVEDDHEQLFLHGCQETSHELGHGPVASAETCTSANELMEQLGSLPQPHPVPSGLHLYRPHSSSVDLPLPARPDPLLLPQSSGPTVPLLDISGSSTTVETMASCVGEATGRAGAAAAELVHRSERLSFGSACQILGEGEQGQGSDPLAPKVEPTVTAPRERRGQQGRVGHVQTADASATKSVLRVHMPIARLYIPQASAGLAPLIQLL